MAGAITTGHRAASSVAVTTSSDWPRATRAMTLAVAGASRMSCAQSPRKTCGSAASEPGHTEVRTGCPVTPWKVGGPTKRAAELVIATRTSLPAWVSAEARSASLYAAIPPATSSAMRRPRSSWGTGVGSSGISTVQVCGARLLNDPENLIHRPVEIVVNDQVVVVRRVLHLVLGDHRPRRLFLCALGVALGGAPHELDR